MLKKIVIVRLDRTIQNLLKMLDSVLRLDRGIKSGNDRVHIFTCQVDNKQRHCGG
jgi:hypothetical protein